jgi:uncharacterized protein YegL
MHEINLFDNPATRCPVVLLIDRSHSMDEVIDDNYIETNNRFYADGQYWTEVIGGGTRMDALNEGLKTFFKAIAEDEIAKYTVEVKVLSFGDSVNHESDFVSFLNIESFSPVNIIPDGNTAMGTAINSGLDILEGRKSFYRQHGISYYQPWMILMTDGKPTDAWQNAASRAKQLAASGKLNFFGVGIGKNFDQACLAKILPVNRRPLELQETKFDEFFLWLSASLGQASRSQTGDNISLPEVDSWANLSI